MAHHVDVFAALDREWQYLCRQQRRTDLLAKWAEREPELAGLRDLADIVAVTSGARAEALNAVARLHAGGDDIARRTLIQLLVPGLIRLTTKWRTVIDEPASVVLESAWTYVGYLRHPDRAITCSPAGYVLRSVERELGVEAKQAASVSAQATARGSDPDAQPGRPPKRSSRSAEDDFFGGGHAVASRLQEAVDDGAMSRQSAQMAVYVLAGRSFDEAAARTGGSTSTYFRHRTRVVMQREAEA